MYNQIKDFFGYLPTVKEYNAVKVKTADKKSSDPFAIGAEEEVESTPKAAKVSLRKRNQGSKLKKLGSMVEVIKSSSPNKSDKKGKL